MRKYFISLVLSVFTLITKSQTPVQYIGVNNGKVTARGILQADSGFINTSFPDSNKAKFNLSRIDGTQYYNSTDGYIYYRKQGFWVRLGSDVAGGLTSTIQPYEPTDTTKLWLDNAGGSQKIWPLKQFLFGNWRIIKYYDPILNVLALKVVYILSTGQSNSIPRCCGGDTLGHPKVAEFRNGIWSKAQSIYTVSNSIGLQLAKNIATYEDAIVRFVIVAEPSKPIEDWLPGGAKTNEIAAIVRLAGIDSFNVIAFRQGERNADLGYREGQYDTLFRSVFTSYSDSTWFGKKGYVLAGGINESYINTGVFNFYTKLNNHDKGGTRILGVGMLGLSRVGGIHIDGGSIDTVGRRYYDVYNGHVRQYSFPGSPNLLQFNDATVLATPYSTIFPSFRTAINTTHGIRGGFIKTNTSTSNFILGWNATINGDQSNDLDAVFINSSGNVGIGRGNTDLTTNVSTMHIYPNGSPVLLSLGTSNQLQFDTTGNIIKALTFYNANSAAGTIRIRTNASTDPQSGSIRFTKANSGAADNNLGFFEWFDGSNNLFHIGANNTNGSTGTTGDINVLTINRAGTGVSIKTGVAPTGYLTLGAGVAGAGGAPLVFTSGTNLSSVLNGAVEYNGTNWFMTSGGVRYTVAMFSTGTAAPAITPPANGALFLDTTNKKLYVATGTSSSADWTILN